MTPHKTTPQRTVQLGDLVAAAYDLAAHYTHKPQKASRLAALAVQCVLRTQKRSARAR